MKIIKSYSHKSAYAEIQKSHTYILDELEAVIHKLDAISFLTKISHETIKVRRWGGLVFSPRVLNTHFQMELYPRGWARWDESRQKYVQPVLYFPDDSTTRGADRYRKMDGLKDRIGLEIQFGKYAFMGYDIFSKMIIFRNKGLLDFGIEIVLIQEMVNCMSTGVSAFEHIMIDFVHRGEADIDVPVLVLGIGPSEDEWQKVYELQELYRNDPDYAKALYPAIGTSDLRGTRPGPK